MREEDPIGFAAGYCFCPQAVGSPNNGFVKMSSPKSVIVAERKRLCSHSHTRRHARRLRHACTEDVFFSEHMARKKIKARLEKSAPTTNVLAKKIRHYCG
jgi:hypothetical protein